MLSYFIEHFFPYLPDFLRKEDKKNSLINDLHLIRIQEILEETFKLYRQQGHPKIINKDEKIEYISKFLLAKYTEPNRYYHNTKHILHCVQEYKEFLEDNKAVSPDWKTFISLLFHDCYYNPLSKTNEEESAKVAREMVYVFSSFHKQSKLFKEIITTEVNKIEEAIISTKEHTNIDHSVVIDCDLSSLGKNYEEFQIDSNNIYKEYVPLIDHNTFEDGRHNFLSNLLKKDKIFITSYFHDKYEEQAKSNIQRYLNNSIYF